MIWVSLMNFLLGTVFLIKWIIVDSGSMESRLYMALVLIFMVFAIIQYKNL